MRAAVHRGELLHAYRDLYAAPSAPDDLRDAVTALLTILPTHAVVADRTAADLYGFDSQPGKQIHIMVPAGTTFPDIKGIATHQAVLPAGEAVLVDGIRCVPPDRCAVDLARRLPRLDALPLLDAALRSGRCTPESLAAEVHRHDRLRGVRQARQLLPLADARSECRQESQLRLIVVDGGLPAPEPQVRVLRRPGPRPVPARPRLARGRSRR